MQIPDNVTPIDPARQEADRAWNEKKKERTRATLVDAAVRQMAERGVLAVTINDIVVEAAVASGTFYNYFPSIEHLVDELEQVLLEQVDECNRARLVARDPGSRMARVIRGHLRRAAADPAWSRLLVQLAARPGGRMRTCLLEGLQADIEEGIAKGQFTAEADLSAEDLVMGALLSGILRVAGGGATAAYPAHLTANILRGLGMVSAAALDRAQRGL